MDLLAARKCPPTSCVFLVNLIAWDQGLFPATAAEVRNSWVPGEHLLGGSRPIRGQSGASAGRSSRPLHQPPRRPFVEKKWRGWVRSRNRPSAGGFLAVGNWRGLLQVAGSVRPAAGVPWLRTQRLAAAPCRSSPAAGVYELVRV